MSSDTRSVIFLLSYNLGFSMNMFDYFVAVLEKYAVFSGRARRKEYWYFVLVCLLIGFVIGFVIGFAGAVAGIRDEQVDKLLDIVTGIVNLALLLPSIAVGVRRIHDVDKSGWFILVPFYNLYLMVQPGTVGPNRFGPDPKGTTEYPEATEPEVGVQPPLPPTA